SRTLIWSAPAKRSGDGALNLLIAVRASFRDFHDLLRLSPNRHWRRLIGGHCDQSDLLAPRHRGQSNCHRQGKGRLAHCGDTLARQPFAMDYRGDIACSSLWVRHLSSQSECGITERGSSEDCRFGSGELRLDYLHPGLLNFWQFVAHWDRSTETRDSGNEGNLQYHPQSDLPGVRSVGFWHVPHQRYLVLSDLCLAGRASLSFPNPARRGIFEKTVWPGL